MNKSDSKYFNTAVRMDRALISLLEKKDLEYITVSEICAEAGVNRSTFYLHYETIGDLLAETTRYLLDDFLSYFSIETRSIGNRMETCVLTELNFITKQYLIPYLNYVQSHRKLFCIAMSNMNSLGFDDVYRNMYTHIFDPILARFQYPKEDRMYVMHFYLNGIMALVTLWLHDDCRRPVEEIVELIQDCIFGRDPSLLPVKEQQ